MKLKDLKLDYPTTDHTIAQGFGQNANYLYAQDGLKGHPAIDFNSPYNAPIYSASRGLGWVYKTFNKDNPDLMKYRAVCELIDLDDCSIELTYGHCHHIDCPIGRVSQGQQIATVGNTGDVFDGTHHVTEAEKENGSTAGRHLHFQMRYCRKVAQTEHDDTLLQDEYGNIYTRNGYYYTYKQNGYRGCIDPAPYLHQEVSLQSQLETSQVMIIPLLKQYIQILMNKLSGKSS